MYIFKREAQLDEPIEYLGLSEPLTLCLTSLDVKTQITDYPVRENTILPSQYSIIMMSMP